MSAAANDDAHATVATSPGAAALLQWLQTRRSVREFADRPVPRELLSDLLAAAASAPSPSNRQPWRFAVVTSRPLRLQIAEAVRERADEMKAVIRRGHHAEDFGAYGDFFHEPLQSAGVIIVPQYREFPDLIAQLLACGGADPGRFLTAAAMQAELCCTSAAVMALLLQAHASGLGACWMAGPTIARERISELLDITDPWRMVGAIALGWPAAAPPAPPRKALARIAQWFDGGDAA